MTLLPSLQATCALMRLDKPIGTWLLLWPTFWALWLASDGLPAWEFLVFFRWCFFNAQRWLCD